MRFGIMDMQIDTLVPSDLPPDQVIAHAANISLAAAVRRLASMGFNHIELSSDLGTLLPHTYAPSEIDALETLKSEYSLSYSVHLPLWSVELSTPLDPVRQGSVLALVDVINKTLPLDPEIYVLHATGALAAEFFHMSIPDMARIFLMRQFQNNARTSIRTIIDQTGVPSRRLAIETIEFPYDLTLEIADELDLSICFDTGHVMAGFSGWVDFFDALDQCLPRLAEVHLHDSPWFGPQKQIGYGKDHQALGLGDIDVKRLLDRLESSSFDGPVVFELTTKEALQSLERIKMLRPDLISSVV